jgi:thiopurine S-methyltransferase
MEPAFWLERWKQGQHGFHREGVHPDLEGRVDRFLDDGPHRVLVPLCGKSHDLAWLADQGHTAVGVELSEVAVRAFFEEQERPFEVESAGALLVFRSDGLELWCGDVFDTTRDLLGPVDRVWDRAALVALPPPTRGRYAVHIRQLAPGGVLLQNAFEYDQSVMSGPPFSVPLDEVRQHYGADRVEVLYDEDVLDEAPRWRSLGHTWWRQHLSRIDLPAVP